MIAGPPCCFGGEMCRDSDTVTWSGRAPRDIPSGPGAWGEEAFAAIKGHDPEPRYAGHNGDRRRSLYRQRRPHDPSMTADLQLLHLGRVLVIQGHAVGPPPAAFLAQLLPQDGQHGLEQGMEVIILGGAAELRTPERGTA